MRRRVVALILAFVVLAGILAGWYMIALARDLARQADMEANAATSP